MTKFEPGELVTVQIKGVRYGMTDPDHGVRFDGDDSGDLYLWIPPGVSHVIERVAPKEWPPQRGDIWEDSDGDEWVARAGLFEGDEYADFVPLSTTTKKIDDAENVLHHFGPMRLVRRRGWTPEPPVTEVDEPAPEQVDERAAIIAGIREVADYAEAHPDLPLDRYTFDAQWHVRNRIADPDDQDAAFAELRRIAAVLDIEPDLRDEPDAPHPNATRRFTGGVEYEAIYVTPAYRRGYKPAEPPDCCPDAEEPGTPRAGGTPEGEHRQVAGWKGTGPGESGVECACGTTFDGFNSLGEAVEMLDRHIAEVGGETVEDAEVAS